jgi:hypothetical protein
MIFLGGVKKDQSPVEVDLFTCPFVYREGDKTIIKAYDTLMMDDVFP